MSQTRYMYEPAKAYHVSEGSDEEEEDGEDSHQCAACTGMHNLPG